MAEDAVGDGAELDVHPPERLSRQVALAFEVVIETALAGTAAFHHVSWAHRLIALFPDQVFGRLHDCLAFRHGHPLHRP